MRKKRQNEAGILDDILSEMVESDDDLMRDMMAEGSFSEITFFVFHTFDVFKGYEQGDVWVLLMDWFQARCTTKGAI